LPAEASNPSKAALARALAARTIFSMAAIGLTPRVFQEQLSETT